MKTLLTPEFLPGERGACLPTDEDQGPHSRDSECEPRALPAPGEPPGARLSVSQFRRLCDEGIVNPWLAGLR